MLYARADHDVVDVGRDDRCGEIHGLLRRAALSIDRCRSGLDRQAGLKPSGAGDVPRLFAVLVHATGDDVIDFGGVHACPLEKLEIRGAKQRARVNVAQRSLLGMSLANGRPDRLDYHRAATSGCLHAHSSSRYGPLA